MLLAGDKKDLYAKRPAVRHMKGGRMQERNMFQGDHQAITEVNWSGLRPAYRDVKENGGAVIRNAVEGTKNAKEETTDEQPATSQEAPIHTAVPLPKPLPLRVSGVCVKNKQLVGGRRRTQLRSSRQASICAALSCRRQHRMRNL